MSSSVSHLGLLDSIARNAERLCEGEFCSFARLLYEIYHKADHPLHKHLHHVFTCNTRASAALGELTLVILCCRSNLFNRSFLPAGVSLWSLLPPGVFNSGTLSSFKSAMKVCLQRPRLYFFLSIFQLLFTVL